MAMMGYKALDGRFWSGALREKSIPLMKAAIEAGRITEYPLKCDWCGQTEGIMNWHAEDYSLPPWEWAGLCLRCHMIVHSRHFADEPANRYLFEVRSEGKRYPPIFKFHDFPNVIALENGIHKPTPEPKLYRAIETDDHRRAVVSSFAKRHGGLFDRVELCWVEGLRVSERTHALYRLETMGACERTAEGFRVKSIALVNRLGHVRWNEYVRTFEATGIVK